MSAQNDEIFKIRAQGVSVSFKYYQNVLTVTIFSLKFAKKYLKDWAQNNQMKEIHQFLYTVSVLSKKHR